LAHQRLDQSFRGAVRQLEQGLDRQAGLDGGLQFPGLLHLFLLSKPWKLQHIAAVLRVGRLDAYENADGHARLPSLSVVSWSLADPAQPILLSQRTSLCAIVKRYHQAGFRTGTGIAQIETCGRSSEQCTDSKPKASPYRDGWYGTDDDCSHVKKRGARHTEYGD